MARAFGQTEDTIDFVKTAPGASQARVQALLTAGAERAFPTAEVLNQGELKETREEQVDQLVNLVYALLAMAIVISLFGIANTLALSIHERTRELGMLRAIGMSRRQVRTMIRYEAVITALIGAILGMVLGIVFAALISQPLKRRLHPLLPDRLPNSAAGPRRPGGRPRGDSPGPPRLPPRRPRLPPIRVGRSAECPDRCSPLYRLGL